MAQTQSSPIGESLRVFSMKCAQKRRPNMMAEVQMKSNLPWSGVRMIAGDVLDPAIGAEFDRADQDVRDEEHEEQDRPDEKR